LDDSQPYFPQCIPPWLIPAGLRVHPGKQQISMGSGLPLPYAIGYSKRGLNVRYPQQATVRE